jgi:hypothetical protein
MIKSPQTCQQFVKNKLLFDEQFYKNLIKLEEKERNELVQIVTESIFYYFVQLNQDLRKNFKPIDDETFRYFKAINLDFFFNSIIWSHNGCENSSDNYTFLQTFTENIQTNLEFKENNFNILRSSVCRSFEIAKKVIEIRQNFQNEILEGANLLNISESSSTQINTQKINEKCRARIIQFTDLSSQDMYTQDKNINEIKNDLWKAISGKN